METHAPRPTERRERRWSWGFASAIAAYVLVRALLLYTAFDQVGLWMYEQYPMGTLAELLRRGVHFPMRFYYDNAAGQILSGFATLPAFTLFGPSYLALKIVPFLLGLGTLLLSWVFLDRHFGRLAANLGAWLLVLAPTTLFKYSLICSGNHPENLFFSILFLVCFYRMHASGITPARLFATGASAGFALFVLLAAVLPVGIAFGIHLGVRGWRKCLADLPATMFGFVLGISPLVVLNAMTQGRLLGFLSAKFLGETSAASASNVPASASTIVTRMLDFLGHSLPRATNYPDRLGDLSSVAAWMFLVAAVAAWLVCTPHALRGIRGLFGGLVRRDNSFFEQQERFERAKLVPLVLYLPLATLAFGVSNFRIGGYSGILGFGGYRYFLPYLHFSLFAIAIVAAGFWERRATLRAAGVALWALAFLPGLTNLTLIDWSFQQTGLGTAYVGYDLSKLARALLSQRNALSHEEMVERLQHFPALVRARVVRAIGFNLGVLHIERQRDQLDLEHPTWWVDVELVISGWPEDFRPELARGAGIAARWTQTSRGDEPAGLAPVLTETLVHEHAGGQRWLDLFLEGCGSPNPNLLVSDQTSRTLQGTNGLIGRMVDERAPMRIQEGLARGQGFLCGEYLRRGIHSDREDVAQVLAQLHPELHAAFFEGLGHGQAQAGEEPGFSPQFAIPAEHGARFWHGFASELGQLYGADASAQAASVLRELDPTARGWLAAELRAH